MPLPTSFFTLSARFATVRAWAEKAFPDINRCAVCMGFTLDLKPDKSAGQATLASQPNAANRARAAGAQVIGFGSAMPDDFFIRAEELLPAVIKKYGTADVEGRSDTVWPRVVNNLGVLFVENVYQRPGDKKKEAVVASFGGPLLGPIVRAGLNSAGVFFSGDHWDLFDGTRMVAEGQPIAGNKVTTRMCFWRSGP